MPELPEVETVKRGLAPHMEGQMIKMVELRRPNLRFPFPDSFIQQLEGAVVVKIERRAKYLLFHLESGFVWLAHLGMSGSFTVHPPQDNVHKGIGHNAPPGLHDHVLIRMHDNTDIIYNDPRRFGYMDVFSIAAMADYKVLKSLGPEALDKAFSGEYLLAKMLNKKSPIKSVLLDQRVVAGLGNIYVCEALWQAGISPEILAGKISKPRAIKLVAEIKQVLERAIAAGGSSLKDYRQADGTLGYFQHQWKVYGREGEACTKPNCNAKIKRITQSGRSSFYCPKHQR